MFSRRSHRKHATDMSCIFVHAGAGFHSRENEHLHLQACADACKAAMLILKNSGTAVDAVEMAIKVLEDREITNAGYGSNPNIDGVVECDAIVVDHLGRSGAAGAVAQIKNPVSLARTILDATSKPLSLHRVPPNFLCGEGATRFAQERGLPVLPHSYLVSSTARARWQKWKSELDRVERSDQRPSSAQFSQSYQSDVDAELAQDVQQQEASRVAHERSMLRGLYGTECQEHLPPARIDKRMFPSPPSSSSEGKRPPRTPERTSTCSPLMNPSSLSPAAYSRTTGARRIERFPQPANNSSPFASPISASSMSPADSEGESYIDPIGPPGMLENVARNPFANSTQQIGDVPPRSPFVEFSDAEEVDVHKSREQSFAIDGKDVDGTEWSMDVIDGTYDALDGESADHASPTTGNGDMQELHVKSSSDFQSPQQATREIANTTGYRPNFDDAEMLARYSAQPLSLPHARLPDTEPSTDDHITDTIGAIAIDRFGRIACAASSGGIGMKHRGRVGPAALVGVGAAVIPSEAEFDTSASHTGSSSTSSSARSSLASLGFGWPLAADGAAVGPPLTPEDVERQTTVAVVTSGTGEHMATTLAASTCADRILRNEKAISRNQGRAQTQRQSSPSPSRYSSPAASPSSASSSSSFFSRSSGGSRNGTVELCTEDEALHSFITHDFLAHPTVRHSPSAGAIGALVVKKSPEGVWMYFGHNTESFALASMHAGEAKPVCTMSRKSPTAAGGGAGRAAAVAQGGRAVRWPAAGTGRR